MTLLTKKRFILAKKEVTYGTDAAPVGATDAMLTQALDVQPVQGDTVEREIDNATLGSRGVIHVAPFTALSFGVEAAGAGGAVDAPPAYAPLLKGCGLAETINVATSVEYDPVSAAFDSLTIHHHNDGNKQAQLGARGNMRMILASKALPLFEFDMNALYADPTASADPTPTYTAFKIPMAVTQANTPTVTIGARSAACATFKMISFNFDMGNEVVPLNNPGCEEVLIVDRVSSGQLIVTQELASAVNFPQLMAADTPMVLQIVHGVGTGNVITFDAPAMQIRELTQGDDNGVKTWEMDVVFQFVSGDDEFQITTT